MKSIVAFDVIMRIIVVPFPIAIVFFRESIPKAIPIQIQKATRIRSILKKIRSFHFDIQDSSLKIKVFRISADKLKESGVSSVYK